MTKKVTVIVEADLDKQTVNVSDDHKVGSMFLLTPQEVTIPANQIQNFIFRKSQNSNSPMFCTGYQVGNDWYGDRPGDGVWINPLENNQKYQRTGETNVRYTPTTPPPEESEGKRTRFIVKETNNGVQLIVESSADDVSTLPSFEDVTYNGTNLDFSTGSSWELLSSNSEYATYYLQSSTKVLSNESSAVLEFSCNGQHYRVGLSRVAYEDGAGTYAIELGVNAQFYVEFDLKPEIFVKDGQY